MCGIMGYTGEDSAGPIVLDGLSRLEYRGYDSAGIAVLSDDGDLTIKKGAGRLSNLVTALATICPPARRASATRAGPRTARRREVNAHPHTDTDGDVVVIHNGIVENYRELRDELIGRGHAFLSETDTEVIPHLIAEDVERRARPRERHACRPSRRIEGAAAMLAMRRQEPGVIVAARDRQRRRRRHRLRRAARCSSPATCRRSLPTTHRVVFLEDGEVARVTADGADVLAHRRPGI